MAESAKRFPLKQYDLSAIQGSTEITLVEAVNYNTISVQLDWKNLTGTLDAKIEFIQRNDYSLRWVNQAVLTTIMDQASDSVIFEDLDFCCDIIGVRITMNGCTGGEISSVVVIKNK